MPDPNAVVDVECASTFATLMQGAEDIEPRLRALWLEIYMNANEDRTNANVFLTNMLPTLSLLDAEKHSLHGQQAVKYLERVSRANDQLLKLAEQIRLHREDEGELDSDGILDKINDR